MTLPILTRDSALFLDVDGTLLEFADHPDEVDVPVGLKDLLSGLSNALGGALAVISGRPIASIDRVLSPLALPASGQHGAEWRRIGQGPIAAPDPPGEIGALDAALRALARERPELFLEPKTYSIAVHYRGAGEGLAERLAALLHDLPGRWRLLAARRAYEITTAAYDKGIAIQRFLAEPPFRGRLPVFLGDDATDEDGFRIVVAVGGSAIRVGPVDRASIAVARLAGPSATLDWLAGELDRLQAGNPA